MSRQFNGDAGPYEGLVRAMGSGCFTLDDKGVVRGVSDGLCELLGREREELVGEPLSSMTESGASAIVELAATLRDSGESTDVVSVDLVTGTGETVQVECWVGVVPDTEGYTAVCAVGAEGNEPSEHVDVGDLDVAGDVDQSVRTRALEKASIALCLSDPTRPDNPLVWVNEGFEKMTGYDAEEAIGENCRFLQGEETDPEKVAELRGAIEDEEPISLELLNYRKDGMPFWNQVDVVPIYDDDGELVHFLGSQSDITERKEHEQDLRQQREQLVALNGLNRVVRNINSGLVSLSTRDEIESLVCRSLAESDSYVGAWIGEANRGDGTVTVRACEGVEQSFVDTETEATAAGDDTPTKLALDTRELQAVSAISGERHGGWGEEAERRGYHAAVAIPIGFQQFQYDVLTIYADRPRAFSGQERDAVAELGQIVGHAINAIERKEALLNNVVTELEFDLRDGVDPLIAATADSDLVVEFDHTVPTRDDAAVQFVRITGEAADDAVDVFEGLDEVDHVRLVGEREGERMVEVRWTEEPATLMFAEYGGYVTEATIEDGSFRVVVELPHEVNVREVIDVVQGRFPDSELVAQRSTTRSVQTLKEFRSAIGDRLTEKQRSALEAAYAAGYFSWPRESTGEEIAEALGVSPPTFHQHLRLGLEELLSASLDQSS
ncbi:bacterio-opsin activator domain-containing protein [Halobium salinum]|uniref:Bacterio-opsin activator domain-containing protein n=1 Tax=Halobium salinum TaxID=1364940 RepID=A0ABD5PEG5_9EURY|nr:bacterio-opsin activator domain-containing protein [Halobium salinum]